MTNDQIDQLLELEAKATPGPWEAISYYDGSHTVCMMRHQTQTYGVAANNESSPWEHYSWNAQLIAAARNSIRELCEEVKAMRESLEKIEDTILTNSVEQRATSKALSIARDALNRPNKQEPAPLVTHHTDDGQIVVTRDTSGT